ncbi:MAG: ice-binding family protein [Hymenobacter sp.]
MTLINGASVSNVYWQMTGRTDLGQNSVMRGTLVTDGAHQPDSGRRAGRPGPDRAAAPLR